MDSEEEDNVFSIQSPLRVEEEEEVEEEEDEEEDGRIFNTWMRRCRGAGPNEAGEEEQKEEKEEEMDARRPESNLDPPIRMRTERRASLPSPAALSSMHLSRLLSSTPAPVTARVLLRRSSSRRLLASPQEADGPAAPEGRPALIPTIPEASPNERRGFRRRNVMSLSDAYSVCLICHNELSRGVGGTRELQCSHTFHRECLEEWLWRKHLCPTCHVRVSVPQPAHWSSTRVNVP
ncbi:uncharacterized protein si:ch211-207l14.1 [Pungitius pungitius]|uniref:uncharacterized protein si:ch211-207l14.1 n=1 Tax=Pungitius pungitius TaxID=134920 RepID=UPI002E1535CF